MSGEELTHTAYERLRSKEGLLILVVTLAFAWLLSLTDFSGRSGRAAISQNADVPSPSNGIEDDEQWEVAASSHSAARRYCLLCI